MQLVIGMFKLFLGNYRKSQIKIIFGKLKTFSLNRKII